jgi:flagellar export protein FliJ
MNWQDFRCVLNRLLESLNKLLKLKKHHIEELRQQKALVNDQIEARLYRIEKNIRYINTERLISSVNITGASTLEAFVAHTLSQNKRYIQENIELGNTLDEIKEQLFVAYVEQKQFEKVREHEQMRVDKEYRRKETQELDEMANQGYLSNLTKI